jgi:hypothetical protein
MSKQLLGHKNGCLYWFDVAECIERCCCDNFDWSQAAEDPLIFLNEQRIGSPQFGTIGPPPEPAGNKWKIMEACVRLVCIKIENSEILCSSTYGGPTVNNLDLITLIENSVGLQEGCNIYTIEFFGWYKDLAPGGWISRDDIFNVYVSPI